MTWIEPLLLPLAWLTQVLWGAGLHGLTPRRAAPAQDIPISFWNCLLLFNLMDIFQQG